MTKNTKDFNPINTNNKILKYAAEYVVLKIMIAINSIKLSLKK